MLVSHGCALRVPQCRSAALPTGRINVHCHTPPRRMQSTLLMVSTSEGGHLAKSRTRQALTTCSARLPPARLSSSSAAVATKRAPLLVERPLSGVTAPTPKTISAHLDEYVIGQSRAKRVLSVAVFGHYLRLSAVQRAKDAKAAAAVAAMRDVEAASPAAASLAEQEISEFARRDAESSLSSGQKANSSSASKSRKDAILTDYVGQTQGSARWSTDAEGASDQGRAQRASSSLSPAYFSSAKWPALAAASSSSDRSPSSTRRKEKPVASEPMQTPPVETAAFEKSNILMIGPSGSGKTHLVRTLATSLAVPFVHADATPLTSAGYVGEDVESMLTRLLEAAEWNVERAERGIICIDEIDKLASPASAKSGPSMGGRDVGGTGVQQALLRILEGTVVSITDKRGAGAAGSSAQSSSLRSSRFGSNAKPWWSPEMQALNTEHTARDRDSSDVGVGRYTQKDQGSPMLMARQARRDGGGQASVLSSGHGTSASDGSGTVKIDTSNILFVCCGAFAGLSDIISQRAPGSLLQHVEADDLTRYGLIPEFVGRLPVLVSLDTLTKSDLVRILTEPRNALVTQYQNLFASFNVKLRFTLAALEAIAEQATELSGASSGARSLRRLLESRLLDTMYEAPGGGVRYALVDERAARGEGEVLVFSRGGRSAWMNAMEEEDERTLSKEKAQSRETLCSAKNPKSTISTRSGTTNTQSPMAAQRRPASSPATARAGIFGHVDEAMLRRRARARLTRPSRVGNLRILTSDN